ncbi:hypothetical protein [Flavobacterium sp.]|uniref:hypothetical protein n=1 Tax=Flavobacterium sp. TaxID=239 RepID=UPI002488CF9E|nr:hypothetical protein [Flavobacterium sp.]MDI1316840.1 hypothetical protein [Flavobacterium sp.]
MKTITPKSFFKLVLFMLILFSAKTFSHPRLPMESNSSDYGTKMGDVKKTTNMTPIIVHSKNNTALKNNGSSRIKLKVTNSK